MKFREKRKERGLRLTSRASLPAFNDIGGTFATPKVDGSITTIPLAPVYQTPLPSMVEDLPSATSLYTASGLSTVSLKGMIGTYYGDRTHNLCLERAVC